MGYLRAYHARLLEFEESIALSGGCAIERKECESLLTNYTKKVCCRTVVAVLCAVQMCECVVVVQMIGLYLFQCILSFWSGFQYAFPTILSYITVAMLLRFGYTKELNPAGGDISPGDLAVASGTIVGFISECTLRCGCHCESLCTFMCRRAVLSALHNRTIWQHHRLHASIGPSAVGYGPSIIAVSDEVFRPCGAVVSLRDRREGCDV